MFPVAPNETERLTALRELDILGTQPEAQFDAVCRLACELFAVPIALVSFVEEDRQWFKAKCGLSEDGTTREIAFCNYTILTDDVFVVEDAMLDPRFADNSLVHGEHSIRFYAGAPLILASGIRVGALCIKDTSARTFSDAQVRQLRDLAGIVVAHLRLHEAKRAREVEHAALMDARDAQRVAETAASFGHWRINVADWTVAWSEGIAAIFGRLMPETGVRDLNEHLSFYHPDDQGSLRRRIEAAIAGTDHETHNGYTGQARVMRPDGTPRIVSIRGVPIRDEIGRTTSIYGVVLDVTQSAQIEDRLTETSAFLRATLENVDQGILMLGPDERVRVHNSRAHQLLELPDDVLRDGASFDTIRRFQVARGEFPHAYEATQHWGETGGLEQQPSTHERHRPNGITLEVSATPLPDGGVVRTFTDITHRIAAERAVQESEARYRALADALPQIVWVMKATDGEAVYVNRQFNDYYGPIGTSAAARLVRNHPGDAAAMDRAWQAVQEGRTIATEVRLRRHDGAFRWHKLVMLPVRQSGDVVEWIGTALDIDDIIAARRKLEDTTDLLRLAQEAAGAAVWDWDMVADTIRHSPESARLHDIAIDPDAGPDTPVMMSLETWKRYVLLEDLPPIGAEIERAIEARSTFNIEFQVAPSNERAPRWLQMFGRIVFDEATGQPVRSVGLHLDVTARRTAEEARRVSEARLRVSEERLALAIDSGSDGLWDWCIETGEVTFSNRWSAMLGYDEGEIEPHISGWQHLCHSDDAEAALRLLGEHMAGRTPLYECEYRMRSKTGAFVWTLARGKVVARSPDGRALRMVGTHIDITRRKEAEQQIAHMAVHDALTGLPNRLLFRDRLDRTLCHAERHGGSFAVLACDLDRFKAVNDTFGHPAGDALLRVVAQRLRSVIGDGDTVARLGGDEFAIILPRLEGPQAASITAQRVIEAVGQPLDLEGHLTNVGVSVGIALGPQDADSADTLFKNADIALYRAKGSGRNTYSFYEPGMDAQVASRNLLENDLRDAVRRGGFVLHYQPILDVAGETTSGFEALLRWQHPTRGPISPAEFIPLAEETGLIVSLGEWALREACREAAGWPSPLRVAVNVSAVQFEQPGLELIVVAALAASGLAPHRLELEITESVLVKDAEGALGCLHRLKGLGVRVALDDFGTGYSSLSYLRRFPFDKIKIDRAFIREIGDPDAATIVQAIVAIGTQFKMTITAEGVETQEQLDRVRQEGCTEVQGFLYSKPLSALDAGNFVKPAQQRSAA